MNIKLSIPEPCHEDWDKMTEAEKTRFCSVCRKNVQDFTQTPYEDIVSFLGQNKGDSVCGVFRQNDLHEMNFKEKIQFFNKKYKRRPLKYFAVVSTLMFTLILNSFTFKNSSQKQGEVTSTTYQSKTDSLIGDTLIVEQRLMGKVAHHTPINIQEPIDTSTTPIIDTTSNCHKADTVQIYNSIELMGELIIERP